MNALSEDRQNAIGQFASFVSLPLERHCAAATLCADLTLSTAIENQVRDQNKFLSLDMMIFGERFLVDEFISSIKVHFLISLKDSFNAKNIAEAFV